MLFYENSLKIENVTKSVTMISKSTLIQLEPTCFSLYAGSGGRTDHV